MGQKQSKLTASSTEKVDNKHVANDFRSATIQATNFHTGCGDISDTEVHDTGKWDCFSSKRTSKITFASSKVKPA